MDYKRFESLTGTPLTEYVHSITSGGAIGLTGDAYHGFVERLPHLDGEHLAYAIDVGITANPREFSMLTVKYLSHADCAVACAAQRALMTLDQQFITLDLVLAVAKVPEVDLYRPDFHGLGLTKALTNGVLVRNVLEKWLGPYFR